MSKSMASCYAKDKIRVNAISPALARTRMSKRASTDEQIIDFMATKQPLKGTMMTPPGSGGSRLVFIEYPIACDYRADAPGDVGWSEYLRINTFNGIRN